MHLRDKAGNPIVTRKVLAGLGSRDVNSFLVVNCLRDNRRMSRVEIARELGLSTATITNITAQLIQQGYVREVGTIEWPRGRRPILLELNRSAGFVVAVEMQRLNSCGVAVFDLGCHLVARCEQDLVDLAPAEVVQRVDLALKRLLADIDLPRERLMAVGVSSPGIIERETGVVVRAANMAWHGVPLGQMLAEHLHLSVLVGNETNLSALGEYRFGVHRGNAEFLYLNVGVGIGAGLVLRGELYDGVGGSAGEVGHMVLEAGGPMCVCGSRGCLEALASETAVLAWVRERLQVGQASRLQPYYQSGKLLMQHVYEEFKREDPIAVAAVRRMGYYLGLAVLNVVNLLNPGMVIIGGGISAVADELATMIAQMVSQQALTDEARATTVVPATLDADAALVGAATLALEHVFSIPVFSVKH